MKRPRLNNLRTFEAAGRNLSFALAAKELNISPPAISQQIRQLEAYLDTPLFVRRHRRLSMTGTGQAYLDSVHEALERLDSVTDQLFPDRQGQSVIIRCTPSVAMLWLVPQLGFFHKRYPDIDLSIRTLDQELGEQGASGADLDIVIGGSDKAVLDGQSLEKLFSSTIMPVCSPKLRTKLLAEQPADLMRYDLIHVLGYDDDWYRWFHRYMPNHGKVPRGLSVDGSLIAIEAAGRGDGVMLGRRPFIDSYLESGELVEVFSYAYPLQADYFVRKRRHAKAGSLNDKVARWLVELGGNSNGTVE